MKILVNGDSYSTDVKNFLAVGYQQEDLQWTQVYDGDQAEYNWNYIYNTMAWQIIKKDPYIFNLDFSIPKFAHDRGLKTIDSGHMFNCGHKEFANYLKKYIISLTEK